MGSKGRGSIALSFLAVMLTVVWIPVAHSKTTASKQQTINCGSDTKPCVVKVLPTDKTKEQSEQEQREAAIKATNDQKTLFYSEKQSEYSGDQVLIGLLQLGVFSLQLWAFLVQARFMKNTVKEMKRGTKAAQDAADAAKASADALPKLERAYVFMRFSDGFEGAQERIGALLDHGNTDIGFFFVNHGKTPAIVREVSYAFEHLSDIQGIQYFNKLTEEKIVPSGGTFGHERISLLIPLNADAIRSIRESNSFLYFYGHVVYEDVFGESHETCFFWCYQGLSQTLGQFGKPEWNKRT